MTEQNARALLVGAACEAQAITKRLQKAEAEYRALMGYTEDEYVVVDCQSGDVYGTCGEAVLKDTGECLTEVLWLPRGEHMVTGHVFQAPIA